MFERERENESAKEEEHRTWDRVAIVEQFDRMRTSLKRSVHDPDDISSASRQHLAWDGLALRVCDVARQTLRLSDGTLLRA